MFDFGPYPSIPKGTRAALKIGSGGRLSADKSEWEAVVYKESGNTLILEVGGFRDLKSSRPVEEYLMHVLFVIQVQIASAAPVGLWKCKVETASKRGFRDGLRKTFLCPTPIYILFNPYSKGEIF